MNIRTFLPLFLAVAVISCEAQNDTITSSLFDMSAASASTVSGPANMRNGSIQINGSISFYDSGGPFSNYSNNENLVLTIFPATTGSRVSFRLDAIDTEYLGGDCKEDYLEVFDGPTTSSPRLDVWCGVETTFWVPYQYVATNTSGALTIRFRSDGSVTSSGWSGTLLLVTSSTPYSVTLPRARGVTGNSSYIIYNVLGPTQLPTDQGFCISTTNTSPSRTNGASCYTALTNRYGTRSFTQAGLGANQTHYMRAFVTPPGGAILYSSTVTYAPMLKALPDLFNRGGNMDRAISANPLN